jgi:hypothetical protein
MLGVGHQSSGARMDAVGKITGLGRKTERDKLFIQIDAVTGGSFPTPTDQPVSVLLEVRGEIYPHAHIRPAPNLRYPCWISNPRLRKGEQRLGEFLVAVGVQMNDKVELEADSSTSPPTLRLRKLGTKGARATGSSERASTIPEELSGSATLIEGAKKRITVNAYERDPAARSLCLQHWGYACIACGYRLSDIYGELGEGYIHVHHLRPISSIGEAYGWAHEHD